MEYDEIISRLEKLSDPEALAGMARYGITPEKAYGVKIPHLRAIAKEAGRNSALASRLWQNNTRETRILASLIEEPANVSQIQMDAWASEFSYWEIVDACCMNLFEKTSFAYKKAAEWSGKKHEYIKRAGFVLMARLAVSDKEATDDTFEMFLPIIRRESKDDRNAVKKAVNWALRQIGKRNLNLNEQAIDTAESIAMSDSKTAKWIASDAIRELRSDAVMKRLKKQSPILYR